MCGRGIVWDEWCEGGAGNGSWGYSVIIKWEGKRINLTCKLKARSLVRNSNNSIERKS